MTGHNLNCLPEYAMRGFINWSTAGQTFSPSNAVYVALFKSTLTPSPTHRVWADLTPATYEASVGFTGTGYTSGGQAVTLSNTYTQTGAAYPYIVEFLTGANPTWTIGGGVAFPYQYAYYYINATITLADTTTVVKPLLTYQDLGVNSVTNNVILLTEPSLGIINMQVD